VCVFAKRNVRRYARGKRRAGNILAGLSMDWRELLGE
jgi:hypothetical protein